MSTAPKPFVWYDLTTTDMEAAADFYASVIGWQARDAEMPDVRYTILSAGEAMVAGIMPFPEDEPKDGARPGWLGYILADDVDAASERVRQAGGTIHRAPADIPGVGRFSAVADPQGAMFLLFKPQGGEVPTTTPTGPGHVGWRELYANDWPSAFDFYAEQFGWTKSEAIDMGPMGTYQTFAAGGDMIGGMMNRPEQIPAPVWLFYFNVAGIDDAVERTQKHGGKLVNGPHQVPGGSWIAQCLDPQGATFAMLSPTR